MPLHHINILRLKMAIHGQKSLLSSLFRFLEVCPGRGVIFHCFGLCVGQNIHFGFPSQLPATYGQLISNYYLLFAKFRVPHVSNTRN